MKSVMDSLVICTNAKSKMFLTMDHKWSVSGVPVLVVESVEDRPTAFVYKPHDNIVEDLPASEFVYNITAVGGGGWPKEARDLMGAFVFDHRLEAD